jgi:ankyrin repeat protein
MREIIGKDGIFRAAANGDTSKVLAMVNDFGVQSNTRNQLWQTPLFLAAENNHTETVRTLVQACRGYVNANDLKGRTPVWIAAANGHTETMRALVSCSADVHTVDNSSCTPVWAAAQHGHTETVRVLVQDCLANVHTACDDRCTPVAIAAEGGHAETAKALVQMLWADARIADNHGRTPVWLAASQGHTETVRVLEHWCRADVNAADQWGCTPLFVAAEMGHTETVRALVECDTDLNIADDFGNTPLHVAAVHDNAAVIWTLVRSGGAKTGSLNHDGKTARDLAPRGSIAYKTLEYLQELHAPGHALYTAANAKKRADGFECPVCLEDTKDDGIAFVPCGHRVCPGCWADMRAQHMDKCPSCRAQIAHGAPQDLFPDQHPLYSRFCVEVREPQGSLPDEQKLYSRFCVAVPQASTATGVDWHVSSTTTDGLVSTTVTTAAKAKSAVGAVTAKAKSAVVAVTTKATSMVFGSKITLKVYDEDQDVSFEDEIPVIYEMDRSKSIYKYTSKSSPKKEMRLTAGNVWKCVAMAWFSVVYRKRMVQMNSMPSARR